MSNASTTLSSLSDDIAAAVERAAASTVTVNARRRFPASGIVWSAEGLIVTANHVVERDDEITVGLPDGRTLPASLVGRDPGTDIALLKVDATGLTPAAQSGVELKPGHLVLAVGRPGPNGPMTSFGVVSTTGGAFQPRGHRGGPHPRPGGRGKKGEGRGHGGPRGPWAAFGASFGPGSGIEGFIRADVAMLPGFSGGPLVTATGEIAGLNTSAFGRLGGITLPNELIDSVVESLAAHGKVRRGYFGVGAQAVQLPEAQAAIAGQAQGLLLVSIEAAGPAANAGLLVGDIVLTIAGTPVTSVETLQETLTADLVGVDAPVGLLRGGAVTTVTVKVGEHA